MYVDKDSQGRMSINDLTREEALLIARTLTTCPRERCLDPVFITGLVIDLNLVALDPNSCKVPYKTNK